jgi:hypothetical protein
MASITLNETMEKVVKAYAERKEIGLTEAANLLIGSGDKRLRAINKYAQEQKAKAPAKPKKVKGKVKAAKAPRAAKAKGPLARKQASKAKPPRIRKAKNSLAAPLAEVAPIQ